MPNVNSGTPHGPNPGLAELTLEEPNSKPKTATARPTQPPAKAANVAGKDRQASGHKTPDGGAHESTTMDPPAPHRPVDAQRALALKMGRGNSVSPALPSGNRSAPVAVAQVSQSAAPSAMGVQNDYQRDFYQVAASIGQKNDLASSLLHLTNHSEGLKMFYAQAENGQLLAVSHGAADAEKYRAAMAESPARQEFPLAEHGTMSIWVTEQLRGMVGKTSKGKAEFFAAMKADYQGGDLTAAADKLTKEIMRSRVVGIKNFFDPSTGQAQLKSAVCGGLRLLRDKSSSNFYLERSQAFQFSGAKAEHLQQIAKFYAAVLLAGESAEIRPAKVATPMTVHVRPVKDSDRALAADQTQRLQEMAAAINAEVAAARPRRP